MTEPTAVTVTDLPEVSQALFRAAFAARRSAYCPYSRFAVGAAVRLLDGRVFTGANVENASFGATICAERSAVAAAVSGAGGRIAIAEVMVVTDTPEPTPPCGVCRQVIAEFGVDCLVHAATTSGCVAGYRLSDLCPGAFGPSSHGFRP